MQKIMKNSKNLKLFVEFNRVGIEEAGFEPKQVLDFLYEMTSKYFFLIIKNIQLLRQIECNYLHQKKTWKKTSIFYASKKIHEN